MTPFECLAEGESAGRRGRLPISENFFLAWLPRLALRLAVLDSLLKSTRGFFCREILLAAAKGLSSSSMSFLKAATSTRPKRSEGPT